MQKPNIYKSTNYNTIHDSNKNTTNGKYKYLTKASFCIFLLSDSLDFVSFYKAFVHYFPEVFFIHEYIFVYGLCSTIQKRTSINQQITICYTS